MSLVASIATLVASATSLAVEVVAAVAFATIFVSSVVAWRRTSVDSMFVEEL